jgi:hypothetical protein
MKERENCTNDKRLASGNRLVKSNDLDHCEISPQVRDVCRDAHGLIYVIDASQENKLDDFFAELQLMTREFSRMPILILSCIRDEQTKRWSTIDVVKDLQLSSLSNPWLVQDCCVEDMNGVEDGFVWILTPRHNNSLFFSNNDDNESTVTHE